MKNGMNSQFCRELKFTLYCDFFQRSNESYNPICGRILGHCIIYSHCISAVYLAR